MSKTIKDILTNLRNGQHDECKTDKVKNILNINTSGHYFQSSYLVYDTPKGKNAGIRVGCCAGTNIWTDGYKIYISDLHLGMIEYLIKEGKYTNVPELRSDEFGQGIQNLLEELGLPSIYNGYKEIRINYNNRLDKSMAHEFEISNRASGTKGNILTLFMVHIIRYATLVPHILSILNMFELKATKNVSWYQAWALGNYYGLNGKENIQIKNYSGYSLFYGVSFKKLQLDAKKVTNETMRLGAINSGLMSGDLMILPKEDNVEESTDRVLNHPYYNKKGTISKSILPNDKFSNQINLGEIHPKYEISPRGTFITHNSDSGDSTILYNNIIKYKTLNKIIKLNELNELPPYKKHPICLIEKTHKVIKLENEKADFKGWILINGVSKVVYEIRLKGTNSNKLISIANGTKNAMHMYFDSYCIFSHYNQSDIQKEILNIYYKEYNVTEWNDFYKKAIENGLFSKKGTSSIKQRYSVVFVCEPYTIINNF